jgi:hypothetical protein
MNVVVSVGIEEGPHVLVNHKVDPLNPFNLVVSVLIVPHSQGTVSNVSLKVRFGNVVYRVVVLNSKEEVFGDAASLPFGESNFTVVVGVRGYHHHR